VVLFLNEKITMYIVLIAPKMKKNLNGFSTAKKKNFEMVLDFIYVNQYHLTPKKKKKKKLNKKFKF